MIKTKKYPQNTKNIGIKSRIGIETTNDNH